jgi:hypothetical protein
MFFDDKSENEALKKELERLREYGATIAGVSKTNDLFVKSFGSVSDAILGINKIPDAVTAIASAAADYDTALQYLVEESNDIQKAFGTSRERLDEFKVLLADTAPDLLQMGIGADKATETIKALGAEFGTTGMFGKEALTELAATSKVTGIEVSNLAENFRNVGVSMYDVGDAMLEVANYAKSVGVSVQAVSKGVVDNLGKMNLYNFENGTKGLTKMAAQAARLGFDMSQTFTVADKVFNPEGAIDLAAGLQRLGVASSALLDPLRAMDLAQNDPEQLQNEIVDLTKTFTKFNQETGKFEILPGEKRRIREIANEMGILPDKLAEMSIKASEFDRKMKSIEFPTANKEEKELIASLSTLSGGTAVISVKDESGKRVTKEVRQLTPEDIERLKEQEQLSSKTIEELAIEQLHVLEELNATASSIGRRVSLGYSTSEESLRAQKAGNVLVKSLFEEGEKKFTGQDVRTATGDFIGVLEKGIIDASKGNISIEELGTLISEKLGNLAGDFESKVVTTVEELYNDVKVNIQENIKEIYKDVGKPKKEEEKKPEPEEIILTVNVKSDGTLNNLDKTELTASVVRGIEQSTELSSRMIKVVTGDRIGVS